MTTIFQLVWPFRMRRLLRAAWLAGLALLAGTPAVAVQQDSLPAAIADVEIPQTDLSKKAEEFIRGSEPGFLFNHSVRTYVFGAMRLKALHVTFNPETAYVAALFHDLGLVPRFASARNSFEIDGANAAEKFVIENGGTSAQARVVWNAIVMHDMGSAYETHQSAEALLLGAGAGSDVDGVDPNLVKAVVLAEILQKVPRLGFKVQFAALASDHCRRKPESQIGWLAALCQEVVPVRDAGSVREEIASAPFAD